MDLRKQIACDLLCRKDEVGAVLRALGLEGQAFEVEEVYPRLFECVRQVVYLRIAGMSLATIQSLWEVEMKLIELLHGDALGSPTWMIDGWALAGKKKERLFLSHYPVGAELGSESLQPGLDFAERSKELFAGQEMGEDALRVLEQYLKQHRRLVKTLQSASPLLKKTAQWAGRF
ncbi:MAG: hypothetical protein ACSHYB_05290 [Roseibacillus sp.]